MKKTILITGATDGIGLHTAKALVALGHAVLIHGRSPEKLAQVEKTLNAIPNGTQVKPYRADLSNLSQVATFASVVKANHSRLDVIINNAGVLKTNTPFNADGMDVRFVVNTLAPYLLTQKLLPLLDTTARVINLSSAAQAPVDLDALRGKKRVSEDLNAYAQSKLAITMWSFFMAQQLSPKGPMIVAINPGSLLATKMVTEGFGIAGKDINMGSDILIRACLSDEFNHTSGEYFDNDSGQFAAPHGDALDAKKNQQLVECIQDLLNKSRDEPIFTKKIP